MNENIQISLYDAFTDAFHTQALGLEAMASAELGVLSLKLNVLER
jgi:hypothetical protein